MSLLTTNRGKFSKTLTQAITELKEEMPKRWQNGKQAPVYFKFYEGVKEVARNGKGTFQIAAHSEFTHHGTLVIFVALAEADSLDKNRFKENSTARLAKEMCEKAGARIYFYGYNKPSLLKKQSPHCWMITAVWKKV